MIEMRKQLSLMKRRISEIDQQEAVSNNDRSNVEETPEEPIAEDTEVFSCEGERRWSDYCV